MIKITASLRITLPLFLFSVLGGCQQYDIEYMGEVQIVNQQIKLPDVKPVDYAGSLERDNVAFHFRFLNIELEDLDYNSSLWIQFFLCGQKRFQTNFSSALYLSEEIVFSTQKNIDTKVDSFFGILAPDLRSDLKNRAEKEGKPVCAKVIYRYPYETLKISNDVELGRLK